MIPIDELTIEQAEKLIDWPYKLWAGQCYGVSCALVKQGVVEGHPVYGHWLGKVSKKSHFGDRKDHPFQTHGWILLPDKRICDPTRWAFTGKKPYIFVGRHRGEYDEGGSKYRDEISLPMPAFSEDDKRVNLSKLPKVERQALLALAQNADAITVPMLFWIANLSLRRMGELAYLGASAITRLGHPAWLPLDHSKQIEREHGPLPNPGLA